MNSKAIKMFYITMLFTMLIAPINLYADTVSETEQEILKLTAEYDEKMSELHSAAIDQEQTVEELSNIRDQQVSVQATISSTKTEIANKQAEIDELKAQIPIMQKQADIIMVTTQQASNQNYLLTAIFNADGASEAIRSVQAYSTLSQASGQVILDLIATKEQLELDQQALEQKQADLELQEHQLELDEAYAEEMIAVLSAQVSQAEGDADETAIMLEEKEKQLEMLKNAGCEGDDVYGVDCGTLDSATGFIRPIDYGYVTNEFNGFDGVNNSASGHRGIDLSTGVNQKGAAIYPIAAGEVMTASYGNTQGNWVSILHLYNGRNLVSSYLHMNTSPYVSSGQSVSVSTQLGVIGETGLAYGAHLHMGIFESSFYLVNPVNPRNYINFPPAYQSFSGRV